MTEERKIKVLCVEDEQDIRDTMAEILRDEGFEVFEAGNGKQGFEAYLQHKPDIIISDIMMPELDGYGFLKMVRESKDKKNTVPFIFLSALGQKENILKGADLTANDYLIKPIDFDILIAKVREKATNAIKVQKDHESNIANLKNQISTALPSEIFAHLDGITQSLKILKDEPYGPLPHRRYVEDLNKLYFDSVKLKAAVINSLDHEVIDNRLNSNEEVFSLIDFLEQATTSLPEKIKAKVEFEKPFETDFCKIKLDKSVLLELIKKVIGGVIKTDNEASIRITLMADNLNQTLIVFFIKSKLSIENLETGLEVDKIKNIGDSQGCYFKTTKNPDSDFAIIFSIPSYRVTK